MFARELERLLGLGSVREYASLAERTTWRVGGPARWSCEPDTAHLAGVLALASAYGVPTYVLGRGSNVLVDDEGLPGLLVSTRDRMRTVDVVGSTLVAEAGVPLPALARAVAHLGYGGYEFLIGIPGTVGAGIAMNAGLTARGVHDVSGVLVDADVVTTSRVQETWGPDRLALRYRGSSVLDERAIVIRGRFALTERSDAATIRHRTAEHLAERRRKQPLSRPTAGSTFRQPSGGPPAGALIDGAGLKGLRVGKAMVSHKHANWIETEPGARAADVRALINQIRHEVAARYDIVLEREVRYLPQDYDG